MQYINLKGEKVTFTLGKPYEFIGNYNGAFYSFKGNNLTQDVIDTLVAYGVYRPYVKKISLDEVLNYLHVTKSYVDNLYHISKSAAIVLIIKACSDIYSTGEAPISSASSIWGIDLSGMAVIELPKRAILDYSYISVFRSKKQAEKALDLVLEYVEKRK